VPGKTGNRPETGNRFAGVPGETGNKAQNGNNSFVPVASFAPFVADLGTHQLTPSRVYAGTREEVTGEVPKLATSDPNWQQGRVEVLT
jgi:hypothetical protein